MKVHFTDAGRIPEIKHLRRRCRRHVEGIVTGTYPLDDARNGPSDIVDNVFTFPVGIWR